MAGKRDIRHLNSAGEQRWLLFLALSCLMGINGWRAAAQPIGPTELAEALKKATLGEEIVIADGAYRDLDLKLEGAGTEGRPVRIRAESPGGVVFSGSSGIELTGQFVELDGFWFVEGEAPAGKPVIRLAGTRCRLANTVIDRFNPADPEAGEKPWVMLTGQHHTVEHCTFRSHASRGPTVEVLREAGKPDHHIVAANHFHIRPPGNKEGDSGVVRIGTFAEADSDSLTTVRGNLFEKCDGGMETVTVSAGRCQLIDNTFVECAGTLTLRHGRGSRVERNLFAGKRKPDTGGIRVWGAGHQIDGNVFIGLTGRGGAALSLMAGEMNPKPESHRQVEEVTVERNLFAANLGPAIRVDEQFGEGGRKLLPRAVVVRANVMSSADLPGLLAGLDRPGVEVTWDRNQVFADNQIPKDITAGLAPPLTKADTGAPWYRDRLP